jgi:hypothetical protein
MGAALRQLDAEFLAQTAQEDESECLDGYSLWPLF